MGFFIALEPLNMLKSLGKPRGCRYAFWATVTSEPPCQGILIHTRHLTSLRTQQDCWSIHEFPKSGFLDTLVGLYSSLLWSLWWYLEWVFQTHNFLTFYIINPCIWRVILFSQVCIYQLRAKLPSGSIPACLALSFTSVNLWMILDLL
jgi:hypothetical protein